MEENEIQTLLNDYQQLERLYHQIHPGSYYPASVESFCMNMLLLRAIKNQNALIEKIFGGNADVQQDTYSTEQAPADSLEL